MIWSAPMGRAQFQAPTDEELKMTADARAPGAAAVYLEMKEIDSSVARFRTYYARIKVLTEKGKELATVSAVHVKGDSEIREIHGRTVLRDGTVIPLTVKPEDLLEEKTVDAEVDRKVFTLPGAEVGCILEYSYDVWYHDNAYIDPPRWEIQQPYFIYKAHYQFTTVGNVFWSGRLPEGVAVKKSVSGTYSIDLADVPPIPDEEWMPPPGSFGYTLYFYYSDALDRTEFWNEAVKAWSREVNNFSETSNTIKEAVASLVTASDSDLDKAKKLYAAVQALDNTDYSRKKTHEERKRLKLKDEKHAQDTWTQKSGSSNAIALLYLAMVRAAGLTANAAEVVDRDKGVFDPSFLDLDQLDTIVVSVSVGGKQIVTDPGEKMCPFGTANWRHSLAGGIGQSAQGPSFTITPAAQYAENTIRRTGILTVDEHGGVTGQMQIAMTGQEALRWRQSALRNDESELKKQFDAELEPMTPQGVYAQTTRFDAIDDPAANLIAVVNIEGTLGAAMGNRLVLPSFFFETRGDVSFVKEEARMEPVDMHYGGRVTDQVTYRFPAGMTVEGAPQDATISWAGHGLLVAKSLAQPGQITVARTLTNAFTLAKPDEYQQLRGFYQKVAAEDQQQLVLVGSAGAGGGRVK
jgi:hypothetical protein